MEQALSQFPVLERFSSQANFFLVRANGHARDLFEHLLDNGIRVKFLHGSAPALQDCLRFTVGTREENDSLLAALAGYQEKLAGSFDQR